MRRRKDEDDKTRRQKTEEGRGKRQRLEEESKENGKRMNFCP
jgi:hypothetical protein